MHLNAPSALEVSLLVHVVLTVLVGDGRRTSYRPPSITLLIGLAWFPCGLHDLSFYVGEE